MGNRPHACKDGPMPRPATGQTPKRNIRIADPIWNAAIDRSRAEKRPLAKVVSEFLAVYGAQGAPTVGTADPWDVVNLVVREITSGGVGPDTDLNAAASAAAELLRALGITPTSGEPGSTE